MVHSQDLVLGAITGHSYIDMRLESGVFKHMQTKMVLKTRNLQRALPACQSLPCSGLLLPFLVLHGIAQLRFDTKG